VERGYAGVMPESDSPSDGQPEFRNTALSDALQTQDLAAVAFALRHGPTVVPLRPSRDGDGMPDDGDVWTHRDPQTGAVVLLLFSDIARKPAALPPAVALRSPGWLRAFLGLHGDEISTVLIDATGPHPMQAAPADLLAALEA
jgi:hypothetical protein